MGDAVRDDFDREALGVCRWPRRESRHSTLRPESPGLRRSSDHLPRGPTQSSDSLQDHTPTGWPIRLLQDGASFDVTAVYALGGMLTGLAGMIEASRLMTGQPAAGNGYELQAIAAVVIGGGSLHGGEGSVIGTLIGAFSALTMGPLSKGSDLVGISPYLQQAIIGAVIILAVSVDELRKRRRRAA
ncbi:MAG: ABC transporter permease [Bryobacteraceae bacterium]